jgi:hypothetical protein
MPLIITALPAAPETVLKAARPGIEKHLSSVVGQ